MVFFILDPVIFYQTQNRGGELKMVRNKEAFLLITTWIIVVSIVVSGVFYFIPDKPTQYTTCYDDCREIKNDCDPDAKSVIEKCFLVNESVKDHCYNQCRPK